MARKNIANDYSNGKRSLMYIPLVFLLIEVVVLMYATTIGGSGLTPLAVHAGLIFLALASSIIGIFKLKGVGRAINIGVFLIALWMLMWFGWLQFMAGLGEGWEHWEF